MDEINVIKSYKKIIDKVWKKFDKTYTPLEFVRFMNMCHEKALKEKIEFPENWLQDQRDKHVKN